MRINRVDRFGYCGRVAFLSRWLCDDSYKPQGKESRRIAARGRRKGSFMRWGTWAMKDPLSRRYDLALNLTFSRP